MYLLISLFGDILGFMAQGRPPKYRKAFDDMAEKICSLGATDVQLADIFGVTEQTVNNWKKKYPSFFESIKRGKFDPDDEVELALFQRATGYEHPEDKIFNNEGTPLIVPTTKHYPPDVTAAIFWLKNRRSKKWRDKQEIDLTADISIGAPPSLEDAEFPDED